MSDYVKYGALILTIVIFQALLTVLFSKWLRSRPKKQQEEFHKATRLAVKFDQFIWRYIFWPMITAIAIWVLYLFFTDQL